MKNIFSKFNITIKNEKLLKIALTHTSVTDA